MIKNKEVFFKLKDIFKNAHIVGCSSSGNILGSQLTNDSVVATAVIFEKSHVQIARINFDDNDDLEKLSQNLINSLPKEDLKHIFLMSDGLLLLRQ